MIYLSKQQRLDADPTAILEIDFIESLRNGEPKFFIFEEVEETILNFPNGTVRSFVRKLQIYF